MPAPCTFTVEPNLLVFTPPTLASNFKPLSIKPSLVFFKSVTLTAAFFVLLSPAAASNLSKYVGDVTPGVAWLLIAEPTLLTIMLPPVVAPVPSSKDAITEPVYALPFSSLKVPSGCLTNLVPSGFV